MQIIKSKGVRINQNHFPSEGYILLQLAAGLNVGGVDEVVIKAMAETRSRLGNRIWAWPVYQEGEPRSWARYRIFFSAPGLEPDESFARNFAEAVLHLSELFYGPLHTMENEFFYPFITKGLSRNCGITLKGLVRRIQDARPHSFYFSQIKMSIDSWHGIPDDKVALALTAAPTLLGNSSLRFAAAFLSAAHHDFYIFPAQLDDAIHEGKWEPNTSTQLAKWEAAFHNSYKAVEAIIGDPPKDESRYLSKLFAAGLNPDEEVGYCEKEPIAIVIRKMSAIRDKRAAHGSTSKRGIQFIEMVEFQECARYVVQSALEKAHGGNLYG